MDGRALTRLRVAFVLLGAALLVPLALLLRSVDARLEAQRRLRHELVAERIFDEMEGELTSLLQREDARPSDAYAGGSTRVENWAPFVVGYFTRDSDGVQILAKPQLAPERLGRLEAALKKLAPRIDKGDRLERARASDAATQSEQLSGAYEVDEAKAVDTHQAEDSAPQAPAQEHYEPEPTKAKRASKGTLGAAAPASGAVKQVRPIPEAIIKQLNRAADVREQSRPASKRLSRDDNDPLSGLE